MTIPALVLALIAAVFAGTSGQTDPKNPDDTIQEPPAVPGSQQECTHLNMCPLGTTCVMPKGACMPAVIDCEQIGGYCAHYKDQCGQGYKGGATMHCPLGQLAMCCLPSDCKVPKDCGNTRWCYDGVCGPVGYCKAAPDCEGQPLEHVTCAGGWICDEEQCVWRCGGATDLLEDQSE